MESRKRSPNAEEGLNRTELLEQLSKKRLFNSKEVSELLGISKQTLRRSIAAGKIKTIRVGRFLRIPSEEVERLMRGEKALLSVQEATELLNVSAATIRILIKAGKIQAFRLAGKGPFKIAKSEVERIAREGA
jgi:excisionase family DNA binding protein